MPPTLHAPEGQSESPRIRIRPWECPPPPPALLKKGIACPENGDIWRGEPGKEVRVSLSFVLSGECSLGAHGLLRFRTNDVLLGTSGVGVCVSVVSNSSGMLYRFPELRPPFNPSVSCWKPSRWREVPSSKPGRPLYLLFTPERAQFCSDAPTNSKSCPHA